MVASVRYHVYVFDSEPCCSAQCQGTQGVNSMWGVDSTWGVPNFRCQLRGGLSTVSFTLSFFYQLKWFVLFCISYSVRHCASNHNKLNCVCVYTISVNQNKINFTNDTKFININ